MTPFDKDRAADLRLQREYGITLAQYGKVLKFQGGVCAICNRLPGRTRLSVDHCHVSGLLRGLLCSACNRAIAHFKDDAERLERAAHYLIVPPFHSVFGILITAPGRVGTKKRAKLLKQLKSMKVK